MRVENYEAYGECEFSFDDGVTYSEANEYILKPEDTGREIIIRARHKESGNELAVFNVDFQSKGETKEEINPERRTGRIIADRIENARMAERANYENAIHNKEVDNKNKRLLTEHREHVYESANKVIYIFICLVAIILLIVIRLFAVRVYSKRPDGSVKEEGIAYMHSGIESQIIIIPKRFIYHAKSNNFVIRIPIGLRLKYRYLPVIICFGRFRHIAYIHNTVEFCVDESLIVKPYNLKTYYEFLRDLF